MILNYNGQKIDVTNWDEFSHDVLEAIGLQLEKEMMNEVRRQNLMGATAQLFGSYRIQEIKGNELIFGSDVPHAVYLEYGTAGRKKGVTDPYGELSQPAKPDRKLPAEKVGGNWQVVNELQEWAKIKGIPVNSYWALAKHIQDYGLSPRSPMRNIFYNKNKMAQIINRAVKVAGR